METTGVAGPVRTWWVPFGLEVGVRRSPSPLNFFGVCSREGVPGIDK